MADIVTLKAKQSAREEQRTIFRCLECGTYSFKVVGHKDRLWLSCSNCETWIQEFDLVKTRDDI